MVNFEPTPEQQRFIEAEVRSGRFRDANEVVREGIELLMSQGATGHERDRDWLEDARRKIEEGWQEIERGETVDGEEAFQRLRQRLLDESSGKAQP